VSVLVRLQGENAVALRFTRSSARVAIVILVMIALGAVVAAVLLASDRVLAARALAKVDTRPATSGKSCTNSCGGGRMLML
jgi:hypothetical protein